MARSPSPEPTHVELEILTALWESGPAGLAEVCARLRRARPVATTTVATMLSVMRRKGLVRRSPGPRGYLWEARLTKTAAADGMIKRLLDRLFDGSARGLVAHLVSGGRLSEEERREVLDLLRSGHGGSGHKGGRH